MGSAEVILLDNSNSAYAMRVKIALAEKGVEYVCKEENLAEKTPLLMEMNPVHKLVPVLIHNGKPICESLVILQYIDQVWADSSSSLLPADPYQRSQAKFWGAFIDKVYAGLKQLWWAKGNEQKQIIEEFIEKLKILDGVLKNDKFFGGDRFGYVDVALIPITCWFNLIETLGNFSIEVRCPQIFTWAKRCKDRPSVSSALPDPEKFHIFASQIRKALELD